jgi:muramoyltetrapeptide carboxypeptidase
MDRRSFLFSAALGTGAAVGAFETADARAKARAPSKETPAKADATAGAPIKPAALSRGDTVGVVALSSPIIDPDDFARIEPVLGVFGLKAKIAPHVHGRSREIKASIRERVGDLHDLFADPSVKAVFCARGGYGASELLPHLDYDVIRANPKVFVGYSDACVVHQAIRRNANLVTFHGPMPVASAMTHYTQDWFNKAVFQTTPIGLVKNPDESNPLRPAYPLRTIVGGAATGRLVGGNLSMIIATMGTPYEVDTKGAIFFLEDVDEEPYRVGRMLIQLHEAGKLDAAAGVIMGKCQNCGPATYKPSTVSPYTLNEHIDQVMTELKVPVLSGLAVGHTDDQLTLPLGAMARLDADAKTLEVLEAGVV